MLNRVYLRNIYLLILKDPLVKRGCGSGLKGFLEEAEGERLYEIALDAGRISPCLEIGGYCGKSTAYIGAACKQHKQVLFPTNNHRDPKEHKIESEEEGERAAAAARLTP